MAPQTTTLTQRVKSGSPYQLENSQLATRPSKAAVNYSTTTTSSSPTPASSLSSPDFSARHSTKAPRSLSP
ncbi:MAG: hypothetical protein Q9190_004785 [Brigantiaea leucoxantha]